jgi:hypothetical protein
MSAQPHRLPIFHLPVSIIFLSYTSITVAPASSIPVTPFFSTFLTYSTLSPLVQAWPAGECPPFTTKTAYLAQTLPTYLPSS